MSDRKDPWMVLSNKQLVFFLVYDILFLVISTGLLIHGIIYVYSNEINIFTNAIINSIYSSLMGSTIYYIRKIYKASIQEKINQPNESNKNRQIGTFIYFMVRPIFSVCFGLVIIVGINAGLLAISVESQSFNANYIFICCFITFYTGFSSGKFIKYLEMKSTIFIKNIFGEKGNE